MKIRVGAATDVGRVRERNEDSLLTAPPLYAVADGMGGHRGGNVASSIAVGTLAGIAEAGRWPELAGQFRSANKSILDRSRDDRSLAGMGTTLTAAFMDGEAFHIAHVGDTRAYLLRDGDFRLLTEDHTLVHQMEKQGRITKEEAETHPQRSILIRALGVDEPLEVDEFILQVQEGDRLLMCSDGLYGMVGDGAIEEVLETVRAPQEVAETLIEMANRAGGMDNITVVVLDFEPGEGVEGTILDPPKLEDVDRSGTAEIPVVDDEPPTDLTVARPIPVPPGRAAQAEGEAASAAAAASARAPAAPPSAAPRQPVAAPPAPSGSLGPPRRRRYAVMALGILLGVALVGVGTRIYLDTRWFVGFHENQVAIFRGIPYKVAGVGLFGVTGNPFPITIEQLDGVGTWVADLKEGVTVGSLEEARDLVAQIVQDVAEERATGPAGDAQPPDPGGGTEPEAPGGDEAGTTAAS